MSGKCNSMATCQLNIGTTTVMTKDGFEEKPRTIMHVTEREFELLEMFANVRVNDKFEKVYILGEVEFTVGANMEPFEIYGK